MYNLIILMKKAFTIISLFVTMMLSGTARAQFFRVRELPKQEVALNFACGLLPDSHLNSCPTVKHSGMGKKSFFKAHDEDGIKFQSFG